MKKSELKELYEMMFPDYPDIVTVAQLKRNDGDDINDGNFSI